MENLTQPTPQQLFDMCANNNINLAGITPAILAGNSVLFAMYQQQLATAIKSAADAERNLKVTKINGMKEAIMADLAKYADTLAELGLTTKENSLFLYAWNIDGKVEIAVGNKTINKERMQTNGENAIVKQQYEWTATHAGITYEKGADLAKVLGLYEESKSINYRKAIEAHAVKHPELNITFTRKEK